MAKRIYKEEDYKEALKRWSKILNLNEIITVKELNKKLTDENLYHGAVGGRQTLHKRLSKLVKAQGELQEVESTLQKLRTEFL